MVWHHHVSQIWWHHSRVRAEAGLCWALSVHVCFIRVWCRLIQWEHHCYESAKLNSAEFQEREATPRLWTCCFCNFRVWGFVGGEGVKNRTTHSSHRAGCQPAVWWTRKPGTQQDAQCWSSDMIRVLRQSSIMQGYTKHGRRSWERVCTSAYIRVCIFTCRRH